MRASDRVNTPADRRTHVVGANHLGSHPRPARTSPVRKSPPHDAHLTPQDQRPGSTKNLAQGHRRHAPATQRQPPPSARPRSTYFSTVVHVCLPDQRTDLVAGSRDRGPQHAVPRTRRSMKTATTLRWTKNSGCRVEHTSPRVNCRAARLPRRCPAGILKHDERDWPPSSSVTCLSERGDRASRPARLD